MSLRIPLLLSLLVAAGLAQAADPATSVYYRAGVIAEKQRVQRTLKNLETEKNKTFTTNDEKAGALKAASLPEAYTADELKAVLETQSGWEFFSFDNHKGRDPLVGSVSLQGDAQSQAVQVNPLNYNLWLGGDYKVPFQLLLAGEVTKNTDSTSDVEKANASTLMNTESGAAIRFPLYGIYQGSGKGLCEFGDSSIGRCMVGGDITVNFKNLDKVGGGQETAFGYAARAGFSLIFPVLGESGSTADADNQGFLAIAVRGTYAHASLDDPALLFTPVTDANGNTVTLKENIGVLESELKFSINQKISIGAKWFTPLNNKDYLSNSFALMLENQF